MLLLVVVLLCYTRILVVETDTWVTLYQAVPHARDRIENKW